MFLASLLRGVERRSICLFTFFEVLLLLELLRLVIVGWTLSCSRLFLPILVLLLGRLSLYDLTTAWISLFWLDV